MNHLEERAMSENLRHSYTCLDFVSVYEAEIWMSP